MKRTSLASGPKIASNALWSPDFAASKNAAPASAGDAKVFWTAFSDVVFSDLLHEASELIVNKSVKSIRKPKTLSLRFRIRWDISNPPKHVVFSPSASADLRHHLEIRRRPIRHHHRQIGRR